MIGVGGEGGENILILSLSHLIFILVLKININTIQFINNLTFIFKR